MSILHLIDKLAGKWLDWRMEQAIKSDPELMELELREAQINAAGYSAAFVGQGVAHLADMLSELLVKNKADNYVSFELAPRVDRGIRPILVTVQWRNGKSPAQVRDELLFMIQRVEWVTDTSLEKFCPICEQNQTVGHGPYCELDAVLKSALKQKIEKKP